MSKFGRIGFLEGIQRGTICCLRGNKNKGKNEGTQHFTSRIPEKIGQKIGTRKLHFNRD
jgi:hypothetical protein